MGDVDRREVVQVQAVVFCLPDRHLRSSVLLVILPPAQDRGMVVVFPVLLSCTFFSSGHHEWILYVNRFSTSPTFCWFPSSVLHFLRWHPELLLLFERGPFFNR